MEEEFKAISIRGRLAFCALALENGFSKNGISGKEVDTLMSKLWEFTSSSHLDDWEEAINEIDPFAILDEKDDFSDLKVFSVEFVEHMKQFYLSIPPYFISLVGDTINVGTSNLYGGTGAFSETTLESTFDVIRLCKEHQIQLPDIGIFKQFSYGAHNGWGNIIQ